jgi:restriction system protein
MARRRESSIEVLMRAPWWVAVVGIIGYAFIGYAIPHLFKASPILAGAAKTIHSGALLFLGACLVIAAFSALRGFLVSRKFDKQGREQDVKDLSWAQFEIIVGEAFRRKGYTVIENSGGGADGGIDLVLRKEGKKFYVQCKQWKVFTVGVKPVRELFGVVTANAADGGFFVTSGRYTEDAVQFARSTSIQLIDGPALDKLIAGLQSSDPLVQSAPKNYDNFRLDSPQQDAPVCPKCGSAMVRRTAKQGANAGKQFWGCSTYPACKGIRN